MRSQLRILLTLVMVFLGVAYARADVVELKNGDKLNGTVGEIAAGKMKFNSPMLGDIVIDMANVKTYSTDAPVTLQPKGAPPINDKIASGDAEKVVTAGGTTLPVAELKTVNAPPAAWHGAVVVNGSLQRGNTNTAELGVDINAVYRRMTQKDDDRLTIGGDYNFGNSGTGSNSTTNTDNWKAYTKYDRFWTEKLYGYANFEVDHDRIAALNYRLVPGVGIGYQWYETPDFNFNTEAGISYVYEDFDPGDTNKFVALRLAYHVDKKLNERVSLFHNLEYLPAFEDPGDYLLNIDAGIRAMLTKSFFTQFKFEWNRDSTPAPGRQKNDLGYFLGVGWQF